MRFTLVDRILELQAGQEITAVKNLSLAEEYLADHFPLFPVLPGVLMLEAMTQAGAWLHLWWMRRMLVKAFHCIQTTCIYGG